MIRAVCIYCASSGRIRPVYNEAAERLGTLLGKQGFRVINGAGSIGLMNVVSNAVLEAGGKVTGVIPRFMVRNGWGHNGLTETIETETMHERKQKMAELADAFIALPGGYGTFEELLEAITWNQLGLHKKPIIILNTDNFYAHLILQFQYAAEENFMRPAEVPLWRVADTPEMAMALLDESHNV